MTKIETAGVASEDEKNQIITLTPQARYRVNHVHLSIFASILAISSAIQVGFCLAENGQVGFVLA